MDNIRAIRAGRRIAIYDLRKSVTNPKLYIVIILTVMYAHFMLSPVKEFAHNAGIGAAPYIFPFFMTSGYSTKIILFLVILLFCDAPFFDNAHMYVLMRSGRRKWCMGQHMYIFGMSAIYTILLIAASNLVLFPYIEPGDGWGKVFQTFAQTGVAPAHGIAIPFDYQIILAFSPVQAMALESVLCWLTFSLFGNIIFGLNFMISEFAGNAAACCLVLFQFVAEDISLTATWFSPASWLSFSLLDIHGVNAGPTVSYAVAMLLILNTVIVVMSLMNVEHREIKRKQGS